jgi:two-component system chemotaxis sensor kinase CheA
MNGFESLLGEFLLDAQERVLKLEQVLLGLDDADGAARQDLLVGAKRELHTLKGNAGMMGLADVQRLAHQMEDEIQGMSARELDAAALLARLDGLRAALRSHDPSAKEAAAPPQAAAPTAPADGVAQGSVRVPFQVLDPLLDQVAELVVLRNGLSQAIAAGRRKTAERQGEQAGAREWWTELRHRHELLERALDVVQDGVLGLRLTPLQAAFGPLRRIVHDEARRAGKAANLSTSGGGTPLDKALLDLAGEALGHLVRNAVVHGLERPEARERAGKPRTGAIAVRASVRGDDVWLEVEDDGCGIDADAVRRACERAGAPFDPADPFTSLFESGVTTKASADLSAGRGVGLAAVREAVRCQGGEVDILSTPGRGTTFRLRLPMTVSIARVLLVRADGETYAIPMTAIVESRRLRAGDAHDVNHARVLEWRERLIPMLDAGQLFGTVPGPRAEGYLVVLQTGGRERALAVDAIDGVQEIVVRRLDPIVGSPAGVGGTTVLGDGRPILILDPRGLMEAEPFHREAA